MQFMELKVEVRQGLGKEVAKKIRRRGLIPAIVYGRGRESLPLVVNPVELLKAMEVGENVIIRLSLGGDGGTRTVIVKELQRHPVRGNLLHADFQEISMEQKITVAVPIHLVGEAIGVKAKGGIVDQRLRELEVECLPMAIPERIEVDISTLDIGDSLHVRDLAVGGEIKVVEDPDRTVVSVVAPEVEVVEEVVEVAAPPPEPTEEPGKAS